MTRKAFFEKLQKQQLVDDSLCRIISGKAEATNSRLETVSTVFAMLAVSLSHAYLVCKMQTDGTTLESSHYDKMLKESLYHFWNPDVSNNVGLFLSLLTFFMNLELDEVFCPETDPYEGGMSEAEQIRRYFMGFKEEAENGMRNIRADYSTLFEIVKRFSIFRIAHFDADGGRIYFDSTSLDEEHKSICAKPILCYHEDFEIDDGVDESELLLLSSIVRGDRSDELMFKVIDPFKVTFSNAGNDMVYYIRSIKLESDSDLKLCHTMGLNIDWGDTLCLSGDFYFLNILADALVTIDLDAEEQVTELKSEYLDRFIERGIFDAIKDWFSNAIMHMSIDEVEARFCRLIDVIIKHSDPEAGRFDETKTLSLYHRRVETRQQRLLPNMPRGFDTDNNIRALVMTEIVLQTVDVTNTIYRKKSDSYSIDDYIQMTDTDNPDRLLVDVCNFIIRFYCRALSIRRSSQVNKFLIDSDDLPGTLERFADFIQYINCEKTLPIIELFGRRNGLCDAEWLRNQLKKFIDEREQIVQNILKRDHSNTADADILKNPYYFVAYAHEDTKIVDDIIPSLRRAGVNICYDKQFGRGDDWLEQDKRIWHSKNCLGVITFITKQSILKDAVMQEISYIATGHLRHFYVNWLGCTPTEYRKRIKEGPQQERDRIKECGGANALEEIPKYIVNSEIWFTQTDTDSLVKEIKKEYEADLLRKGFSTGRNKVLKTILTDLKYGNFNDKRRSIPRPYDDEDIATGCVFPMLVSVRETSTRWDKLTLSGYEILSHDRANRPDRPRYLMSPKGSVEPGEYFCVPNKVTLSRKGVWMYNPYLEKVRDSEEQS